MDIPNDLIRFIFDYLRDIDKFLFKFINKKIYNIIIQRRIKYINKTDFYELICQYNYLNLFLEYKFRIFSDTIIDNLHYIAARNNNLKVIS